MSVIQGNAFSDDEVDTGDIGHSLRFRGAQHLNRTFGTPTANTSWACSWWQKDCTDGATKFVLGAGLAGFGFHSSNVFRIWDNSGGAAASSTALFRDPTGHSHYFVRSNGTNIKAYQNNVEIASYTGTITSLNSAIAHMVGRYANAAQDYLNDYLSRFAFVDNGGSLTPGDFAYLNTEINEWVSKSQSAVKAVVDAGGTNSTMLDFDDPNFATYNVGKDFSSKGNHWTPNNFSLTAGTTYDHMLDVPGNSYATLNPIDLSGSLVLSAGNLHTLNSAASVNANTRSTLATATTPIYAEYINNTLTNASLAFGFGLASVDKPIASCEVSGGVAGVYGFYASNVSWLSNGAGANIGSGPTIAAGTIIQLAYDPVSGKGWIGKNNVWYDSSFGTTGNPSTGANPCFTIPAGSYKVAVSNYANNGDVLLGQAPLHASATYDSAAGGYFRYAPPTGFKALCQANLPDVAAAVLNPTDGFVAVTATEDNIDSTLASARSGWSDFVDVKKNLAAAESWAWQLSHDSTNEYAVSASSLVRQAKRAMSGSNTWEGFSIRIGASYGTAAGSVSHTNGVATTITHNIGVSARQMILLFNRAGGTAVPMYHPDLTSGELLDLCTTAADAASTAITSVLTNSFQIGSGVATGTYDYLVCSELSGLFDLGKWTGNASADGAYYDAGHKPSVLYAKALSTTDDHRVYNALRPGYNVIGGVVLANTTAAETTAAEMDFTSQGMKARITTTPNAAQTYVTASWASVAGKYSLGR